MNLIWLESDRASAAAVLLGACLLGWLLSRLIARRASAPESRQRWRHGSAALAILVALVGLTILWSREIQDALLAFTALAVAFVLGFKELLLCAVGGLYRLGVGLYGIGDRVEVNGLRGDVVDVGLLSTTLLEVGPSERSQQSTGRLTKIPHSLLLSHPVHDASEAAFRWHEVSVLASAAVAPERLEEALKEIGEAEHEPIQRELDAAVDRMRRKVAYRPPPSQPAVFWRLDDRGRIEVTLRYAVPIRQQRVSEDRVVRRLVERFGSDVFASEPRSATPGEH